MGQCNKRLATGEPCPNQAVGRGPFCSVHSQTVLPQKDKLAKEAPQPGIGPIGPISPIPGDQFFGNTQMHDLLAKAQCPSNVADAVMVKFVESWLRRVETT